MNPGYLSIWIMTILFILIATGWKSQIAPDLGPRMLKVWMGVCLLAMTNVPLWWSPAPEYLHAALHVSVWLLLLTSITTYKGTEEWSYVGYLILCALMIAIIWGFIRKIYSYDPVFYWIDPRWDAPLLAGIFCGAFTSQFKQQCSMLIWGAVLGEAFNSVLQTGAYTAQIGSLSWWDSFWIALSAARLFSLLVKGIKLAILKLNGFFWQSKGGRSS